MEVAQVGAAAVGVHTVPGPAHAAAVRHTVLGAACRIVLAVAAAALGTVDSQYPGLPHTAVTAGTLLCAAYTLRLAVAAGAEQLPGTDYGKV
jgi:hypothetical protein